MTAGVLGVRDGGRISRDDLLRLGADYADDDALVAAVDALDSPPEVVFDHMFGAHAGLDIKNLSVEVVELVFDHMFGAHAGLDVEVVAPGGSVVVIGGNHDQPRIPDLTAAIGKDVTIQPFDVFNLAHIDRVLRHLSALMASGALSVRVTRRYDLDEAAAAHRAVEGESFVGKLVVEP